MTITPEPPKQIDTAAASSTSKPVGPWNQRNLDTAREQVRRWVTARNALNTAKQAFEAEDKALKYAEAEGLLKPYQDAMNGEYDFSSEGVVFSKQTRRTWAMDCYWSCRQPSAVNRRHGSPAALREADAIAQRHTTPKTRTAARNKATKEPRISESLRARMSRRRSLPCGQ